MTLSTKVLIGLCSISAAFCFYTFIAGFERFGELDLSQLSDAGWRDNQIVELRRKHVKFVTQATYDKYHGDMHEIMKHVR